MNIAFADFTQAATRAMANQGLSGEDSVIHMRKDDASVNAMGRTWRPWGSSGRTAEFKAENRATRQALLDALSEELNIDFTKKKEIPESLLKVLNLNKFSLDKNGKVQSHKPLTARRITLISKAVDEIKTERTKSAQASMRTSVSNAVKSELDALVAKNSGQPGSISDRVSSTISRVIANDVQSGKGVDKISRLIVDNLVMNAASYMKLGADQAFPALTNEGFEGLKDQVKDFVSMVVGNLPNGVPPPAPKAEEHVFNFQSEHDAVAPQLRAEPIIQPNAEEPKVVSNVTVKMNADDFFKLMQNHVEEAKNRPGVEPPRFRLVQNESSSFLTWMTGLAKGRNDNDKMVKNAEELTDKVLDLIQRQSNATMGYRYDYLFPGVRKAVMLADGGTPSNEAWKDIRADLANIIARVFDFKAE